MATDLGRRIGARIARRRTDKGWTQEQLGAALKDPVDAQTVSRWERGAREPGFGRLEQIAAVLGGDAETLLSDLAAEHPTEVPELRGLLDQLGRLRGGRLRAVRKIVEATLEALASDEQG